MGLTLPIAAFLQQPHPPAGQGSLSGQGGAGLGWAGLGEQRCSPRVEALDPALQGHIYLSQRTGERGSKTQTGFASSAELMAMWRWPRWDLSLQQPLQGRSTRMAWLKGTRWKVTGWWLHRHWGHTSIVSTPSPPPAFQG